MNCPKANKAPPQHQATSHRLCIAPMMGVSHSPARRIWRLLAPKAYLYSEMLTADAVRFGDTARLLAFDAAEQPLALQLGGCCPDALAQATRLGAEFGYSEINLNVGCPSARVQAGRFGACLMREPSLVAQCLMAMRAAAPSLIISIKCRLGVDDQDADALWAFLDAVYGAGVRHIIMHARKAWLQGVSPKDNRARPPLHYDLVYEAKRRLNDCTIILNGGLDDVATTRAQLSFVDGVMLGRAVWRNPWILPDLTCALFPPEVAASSPATRADVVQQILPDIMQAQGAHLAQFMRALLGLYHGQPGGRHWRRWLVERVRVPQDLMHALAVMARYPSRPAA